MSRSSFIKLSRLGIDSMGRYIEEDELQDSNRVTTSGYSNFIVRALIFVTILCHVS